MTHKVRSRRSQRLAVDREVMSDLDSMCRHALQVRRGSLVECMVCGDALDALTGRTQRLVVAQGDAHMRYIKPIRSNPVIGQRAAAPVSTSEMLKNLGYHEVAAPRKTRIERDMVTSFRRSGGKGNGYCPILD